MNIIINDDNLQLSEVEDFSSKSRAILIDDNNKVLIANYGGVFLFPGGSIDKDENPIGALTRELREETGREYCEDELNYFSCLEYYQKNYPKRNGSFQNRLVKTYYFVGKLKDASTSSQLTEKEKKDSFKLEFIPVEELEEIVFLNTNDNPRNIYFQNEIREVLKAFEEEHKVKRLMLKK